MTIFRFRFTLGLLPAELCPSPVAPCVLATFGTALSAGASSYSFAASTHSLIAASVVALWHHSDHFEATAFDFILS